MSAGEKSLVLFGWDPLPLNPGAPTAAVNINNNLGLIVTGPTGAAWRGNVLSGGDSTTGGTADRKIPWSRSSSPPPPPAPTP